MPRGGCTLTGVSISPLLAFLEGPELIIILVILLVLFGGAKLPQLARSVGSAQREFKKGLSGDEDDANAKDAGGSNSSQSANTAAQAPATPTPTDTDKT